MFKDQLLAELIIKSPFLILKLPSTIVVPRVDNESLTIVLLKSFLDLLTDTLYSMRLLDLKVPYLFKSLPKGLYTIYPISPACKTVSFPIVISMGTFCSCFTTDESIFA